MDWAKTGNFWIQHKKTEKEETKEMSKENIVLIGMPGVGKSTVGVILAKVLGYQFIDADLVIQKRKPPVA